MKCELSPLERIDGLKWRINKCGSVLHSDLKREFEKHLSKLEVENGKAAGGI